MSDIETI